MNKQLSLSDFVIFVVATTFVLALIFSNANIAETFPMSALGYFLAKKVIVTNLRRTWFEIIWLQLFNFLAGILYLISEKELKVVVVLAFVFVLSCLLFWFQNYTLDSGPRKINDNILRNIIIEMQMFQSWAIDMRAVHLGIQDLNFICHAIFAREKLIYEENHVFFVTGICLGQEDYSEIKKFRAETRFDENVDGFCRSIGLPINYGLPKKNIEPTKEIIACAKCGQKCRVPKVVKIEIKCSNCSFKWTGSY
jgi:hypothetical protein